MRVPASERIGGATVDGLSVHFAVDAIGMPLETVLDPAGTRTIAVLRGDWAGARAVCRSALHSPSVWEKRYFSELRYGRLAGKPELRERRSKQSRILTRGLVGLGRR